MICYRLPEPFLRLPEPFLRLLEPFLCRARREALAAAFGLRTYCWPLFVPSRFVLLALLRCALVSDFHASSGRYRLRPREGVPSSVRHFWPCQTDRLLSPRFGPSYPPPSDWYQRVAYCIFRALWSHRSASSQAASFASFHSSGSVLLAIVFFGEDDLFLPPSSDELGSESGRKKAAMAAIMVNIVR